MDICTTSKVDRYLTNLELFMDICTTSKVDRYLTNLELPYV